MDITGPWRASAIRSFRGTVKGEIMRSIIIAAMFLFLAQPVAVLGQENEGVAERQEIVRNDTGTVTIAGETITYTASAGTLLLRDDDGQPTAEMFYIAYVKDDAEPGERPVTFLWGGGPGGASFAPNIAGFGPLRLEPAAERDAALSPYRLQDNANSLLDVTDLVFLDPVGTGYSRALGAAEGADFWGLHEDADAMANGIMRYLDRENRWASPKFLWGVSYGTARAAMLANTLQNRGVALNGVMLVAPILNLGAYSFGMDHGFKVTLPTMAAVAYYHGKAGQDSDSLDSFLDEARAFAWGDYARALAQGNRLSEAERRAIAGRLAGFTGIDADYLLRANLRLSVVRFRGELLRDRGLVIGRSDGRVAAADFDQAGEEPETDPSMLYPLMFPAVSAFKEYLISAFDYPTERPYVLMNEQAIMQWNWKHTLPETAGISQREIDERNIFPMTAYPGAELAAALRHNPSLQVYVANGYYDFATPLGMAEYDISHMTYDSRIREKIDMKYYPAGHSIYMDELAVKRMKADLVSFYERALGR